MHSNQKKESKQVRNQKPFIKRYVVVQPAVHGIVMIHLDAPFCVLEQQPKYRPVQQQLQTPELVGIQEAQAELAVIHWCDPVFHHGIHPEYSTQRLCCARVDSTRAQAAGGLYFPHLLARTVSPEGIAALLRFYGLCFDYRQLQRKNKEKIF